VNNSWEPTIVLAEVKTDPEHFPNSLSWHFLCTTVWQTAKEVLNLKNIGVSR